MSRALLKSTVVVGLMTLISRVLGLLREVVFAVAFGAVAQMDAFLVAFKIPNFFRRLFAEGAFSQAFVPVLSEAKTRKIILENELKNELETERAEINNIKYLISEVAGLLGFVVFLVSLLGMVFAFFLVFIFAPGFWVHPEKFALTEQMLRIMFPYLFFISLTALSGGVLNTYGRFWVNAFTPCLLNIFMMGAALGVAKYFVHPTVAVAWGVSLGGAAQLLFQLPFVYKLGLLTWPRVKFLKSQPEVKKILKLMVPAIFGASVVQIGLLIDTIFASFLQTGSVSWLYYSDRLSQFPLGIFGVALGTVVLPHLSSLHAKSDHQNFNQALNWALKLVLTFALPAAVGLALLAQPIVETIYHYGKFTELDAVRTAHAVIIFSIGLFFFIAIKVLVSAFYSRQNMKTPVKIALAALGINLLSNLILIYPLGYLGIALATVLSAVFNAVCLLACLHRQKIWVLNLGWFKVLGSSVLGVCVMAGVLYFIEHQEVWTAWHALSRLWHLVGLLFLGGASYLITLGLLGARQWLKE